MTQHFEVIGDEYDDDDVYDVDGDVMGDVMGGVGYAGPMGDYEGSAIVGYDDYGEPVVVGRRGRPRHRGRRRVAVRKPRWRQSQLAPGVIAPDQGMLSLPMTAPNANTFDSANATLTFEGQVQKPFRGERILVSTVRTGATAVGRLVAQVFVGTDLQQLDVAGIDIEQVGDPNAFGVRLAMKPAQPGVFIRLVTTLTVPLTAPDTIAATIQILGRNIH